jgi:hypothetical protein
MNKITTLIVAATLTFASLYAGAIHHKVSGAYIYNGHNVYSVKIYNNRDYSVYCTLNATNGAHYSGNVSPHSWSGDMRINDINATFTWSCGSSTM